MTSPKEALKEIRACLGPAPAGCSNCCEGCKAEMNVALSAAEATIPVAELEHQAVELLNQHKEITDEVKSLNRPLSGYVNWKNDRDKLLAQLKALK